MANFERCSKLCSKWEQGRYQRIKKTVQLQSVDTVNKVYSYFMNVESQWDGMVGGKPLFPGTGHGDELEYVFGLTKDWRYPYHNNYLDPLDWEHDVTLFCERLGLN